MSEDLTVKILEQQNERLEEEIAQLKRIAERPIQVTSPDSGALKKIEQYLPQLTHIATNLAHAASAIQKLEPEMRSSHSQQARIATALERIADALEGDDQ